jgi:PsbP
MKRLFLFLLHGLAFSALAFSPTAEKADAKPAAQKKVATKKPAALVKLPWLDYANSDFGYQLSYPSDWQFKAPNAKNTFFIDSPMESEADPFVENINCTPTRLPTKDFDITLVEPSLLPKLSAKPDFKMIQSKYIVWNGAKAWQIEYTFSNDSDNMHRDMHMVQRMAVYGDRYFTVTFTALDASFSKYFPTAEKIFDSIKVT